MKNAGLACAAVAASAIMGAGSAQAVEEVRFGVIAHNIQVLNGKNANKEAGPDVELEALWGAPGFFPHWFGAPRPYLLANVNTQGQTSFAAGGLEWHWEFAPGWHLAPGLGLAVHDGDLDNPFPNGSPQATQYQHDHLLLGSRELFHTQLGVTRDLGAHFAVEAVYEHLSNGQIFHQGRNQGIDEAGLRLGYRFGR